MRAWRWMRPGPAPQDDSAFPWNSLREIALDLARTQPASALPSASARLADGLGLKGVLPCAGWAGLTDAPRGISSGEGPPLPQSCGIRRLNNSTCAVLIPASF